MERKHWIPHKFIRRLNSDKVRPLHHYQSRRNAVWKKPPKDDPSYVPFETIITTKEPECLEGDQNGQNGVIETEEGDVPF